MSDEPRFGSNSNEIKAAVDAADSGQAQWQSTPIDQRIQVITRYAELLGENAARIASLISRETNKLINDSGGEVRASIAKAALSIQAIQQRRRDQLVSTNQTEVNQAGIDPAVLTVDRRLMHAPLGTVLVLGPFNFPLHLPGGQIIPALLAGNAVVFKPSELATDVGREMLRLWRDAGLPDSVMQLITGGPEVAIQAIDSPKIDAVFFTGSRAAGVSIHRQLAGRPEVLLALEMGGNNPIVVDADVQPDRFADVATFSAFASSGQRCTCARRVIMIDQASGDATTKITSTEQFDRFVEKAKSLKVGSDAESKIGPLVNENAVDRLRQTFEKLVELGCEPVLPFQQDSNDGNLVHPIILDGRSLSDKAIDAVGEMEWFGPLVVRLIASDLDHAIELANRTPYGLSAALLGDSPDEFHQFASRVKAGVINFNAPTTGAAGLLPFGGRGHSGNHRAAGFQVIDFCCDPIASIQSDSISPVSPWESI